MSCVGGAVQSQSGSFWSSRSGVLSNFGAPHHGAEEERVHDEQGCGFERHESVEAKVTAGGWLTARRSSILVALHKSCADSYTVSFGVFSSSDDCPRVSIGLHAS